MQDGKHQRRKSRQILREPHMRLGKQMTLYPSPHKRHGTGLKNHPLPVTFQCRDVNSGLTLYGKPMLLEQLPHTRSRRCPANSHSDRWMSYQRQERRPHQQHRSQGSSS